MKEPSESKEMKNTPLEDHKLDAASGGWNMGPSVRTCPDCGQDTLVQQAYFPGNRACVYYCSNCGYTES